MRGNKNRIILNISLVFVTIILVLVISWTTGPFYYHFSELRLVTLYSFFQLIATGYISLAACRNLERGDFLKWPENASARPFFLCALGFLFLGLDEILSIHENIDKFIHHLFRMKETALTDHIDDLIVLAYAIIALIFIRDFIKEFKRHPYMLGLLIGGIFLFFMMSITDFLSNNIETFTIFFFKGMSYGELRHRQDIFRMVEDSFKLIGEAFFLSAFLAALTAIQLKKKSILKVASRE